MKTPEVKLKNVKTFEGHDTMLGLNADVWIDGVKCMHLYDSAYGGCYDYTSFAHGSKNPEKIRTLIKNLEDYIKTRPETKHTFGGKTISIKPDMDIFLNDIYEEMEMEKKMKKAILIGVPNDTQYQMFSWKGKPALSKFPKDMLQKAVDKMKREQCTDGKVILNTNLTALGITI